MSYSCLKAYNLTSTITINIFIHLYFPTIVLSTNISFPFCRFFHLLRLPNSFIFLSLPSLASLFVSTSYLAFLHNHTNVLNILFLSEFLIKCFLIFFPECVFEPWNLKLVLYQPLYLDVLIAL